MSENITPKLVEHVKKNLNDQFKSMLAVWTKFSPIIKNDGAYLFAQLPGSLQRNICARYMQTIGDINFELLLSIMNNHFASAEILARVSFETVLNLAYISSDEGDRAKELIIFSIFENKKNANYYIDFCRNSTDHAFLGNIARSRYASAVFTEQFLVGKLPERIKKLPAIKQRFQLVGAENIYHAFYKPLCDSIHTFSDDLVNDAIILREGFQPDSSGRSISDKLEDARHHRAWMAAYNAACAIEWLAEILCKLAVQNDLSEIAKKIEDICLPMVEFIQDHDQFFDENLT
jgi:hypothetical protein